MNADVSATTGQRVSYSCNSPFQLASNEHRSSQCDPLTGQWTKLPECTCPTSELPDYIEIIQIRNNSLKYQCREPRIGRGTIFCDSISGHWLSQPLCFCPQHGFPYIQSTYRNASQLFPYQCKSELNLTGSGQLSCDLMTGRWSQPNCSCRQPTVSTFVKLIRQNNVINYECIGPLVGKGSLTCDLTTGGWSTVNCNCRDPVLPEFASISSRTGNSISLSCPNYLELTGSQNMDCDMITGQWSAAPKCRCAPPPVPWELTAVDRTDFSIEFKCDDGFDLVGNSPVYCDRTTGLWDPLPKCRCMAPPTPKNATTAKRDDSFIQYPCNEDFEMTGEANISCDESGRWTTRLNCTCL